MPAPNITHWPQNAQQTPVACHAINFQQLMWSSLPSEGLNWQGEQRDWEGWGLGYCCVFLSGSQILGQLLGGSHSSSPECPTWEWWAWIGVQDATRSFFGF